jgi:hypothetical protein
MHVSLDSHHRWQAPHQHAPNAAVTLDGPTLVQRSSESSATSTCKPGDNWGVCQKPANAGNTTTIIIGVAVAVPLTVAALVLFCLHRRVKRKHAQEDRDDKYKSLDFGLDVVPSHKGRRGKGVPEMTITDMEKSTRDIMHNRGVSFDLHTPYLLPANNDSSTSLRSLPRSLADSEGPYRPVAMNRPDAFLPNRSTSRPVTENASVYTDASADSLGAGLLSNAQHMSHSNFFPDQSYHPAPHANGQRSMPGPPQPAHVNTSFATSAAPRPKPAPPAMRAPSPEAYHVTPPSPTGYHDAPPALPVHQQQAAEEDYEQYQQQYPQEEYHQQHSQQHHQQQLAAAPAPNTRRVSVMGLRPLPLDHPEDNPEQRANRIRSFYKEYFDETKPNPQGQYQYDYQNDYEADIYADYTAYMHQAPQAPYAQPMARRAMTPPPRVGGGGGGSRVRSNTSFGSTGHIANPAFRRPAPHPKKQLPPPISLTSLPTPSAMTDGMTFTPTLFAPPVTYRDRQAGRTPDSPSRPYSPSVRAFTPLVTSFDDLSVIPSA